MSPTIFRAGPYRFYFFSRKEPRPHVTNISRHGLWLLLEDRELFLPFEEFPWFATAPVSAILKVERPQPDHLYWPDLDIDLAVESIERPERFPLKARTN